MAIDPANYLALKSASAITGCSIQGDVITVTSKAYDPATGEKEPDSISQFSLSYFQERLGYYQTQIANLGQIITDCQT